MPLAFGTGAFLLKPLSTNQRHAPGDKLHAHAGLIRKTGTKSWKNVKYQRVFLNLSQLTGA
jgi:hypothetical protein